MRVFPDTGRYAHFATPFIVETLEPGVIPWKQLWTLPPGTLPQNTQGVQRTARFDSPTYSREELVAEFGSALLCRLAGIEMPVLDNQTGYIMDG